MLEGEFQRSSHHPHVVGLLIAVVQNLRHHDRIECPFDTFDEYIPEDEFGVGIGSPTLVNVFGDDVVTVVRAVVLVLEQIFIEICQAAADLQDRGFGTAQGRGVDAVTYGLLSLASGIERGEGWAVLGDPLLISPDDLTQIIGIEDGCGHECVSSRNSDNSEAWCTEPSRYRIEIC